jgi:hypothetical protein
MSSCEAQMQLLMFIKRDLQMPLRKTRSLAIIQAQFWYLEGHLK